MKPGLILLFGCLIPFLGRGQSALDRGDRHIARLDYQRAVQVFEQALEKEYQDELALRLGFVYWQIGQADKARYWYRQAIRSEVAKAIDFLRFAQLLARANNCSEAEDWYARYLEASPFDQRAKQLQDLCAYQDSLRAKNFGFFDLQPAGINSVYADRTAFFTSEGLWFASERPFTTPLEQVQAQNNQPFADLYWVPFSKNGSPTWPLDPQLDAPVRASSSLNSPLHESNPSWCPSTRELYFTRSARLEGKILRDLDGFVPLEIVFAKRNRDDSWEESVSLPFTSSAFNFLHPAVHPSGEWLLFASDLPGGYGGMDLYISQRTRCGWGIPINLGPSINTEGQELFPTWWPADVISFASD
ncbi:MAG: tetratricopeptide repeat protein, partial [Bacteroidota bacterium]